MDARMSLLDKVMAAVTPGDDSARNLEARSKARAAAGTSGWLALVLEHHQQIESAFAAVKEARSAVARKEAQKWLATLLTGHSNAEEAVLYPAMANTDQKSSATELYAEQSVTKVQMAALDMLDPMSQDYLDKLEHIRSAVAHHVAEEEGEYFPQLRAIDDSALQGMLTRRFKAEFERYMGDEGQARLQA
jgi:hemerythrin superfamily protein